MERRVRERERIEKATGKKEREKKEESKMGVRENVCVERRWTRKYFKRQKYNEGRNCEKMNTVRVKRDVKV